MSHSINLLHLVSKTLHPHNSVMTKSLIILFSTLLMTKALAAGASAQARARVLASVSIEKSYENAKKDKALKITPHSIISIIQKNKSHEIKSDGEGRVIIPQGRIEIIF